MFSEWMQTRCNEPLTLITRMKCALHYAASPRTRTTCISLFTQRSLLHFLVSNAAVSCTCASASVTIWCFTSILHFNTTEGNRHITLITLNRAVPHVFELQRANSINCDFRSYQPTTQPQLYRGIVAWVKCGEAINLSSGHGRLTERAFSRVVFILSHSAVKGESNGHASSMRAWLCPQYIKHDTHHPIPLGGRSANRHFIFSFQTKKKQQP